MPAVWAQLLRAPDSILLSVIVWMLNYMGSLRQCDQVLEHILLVYLFYGTQTSPSPPLAISPP